MKNCLTNIKLTSLIKRIAVVLCIMFACTSHMSGGNNKTGFFKVNAQADPLAAGKVYVSTSNATPGDVVWKEQGSWELSQKGKTHDAGNKVEALNVAAYVFPKPNYGYYFDNWVSHEGAKSVPLQVNGVTKVLEDDGGTMDKAPVIAEVGAYFLPILVEQGNSNNTRIQTNDLGGTATGTVTFNVNNANDANGQDFVPKVDGVGYSYESMSCNVTNKIVTVTVRYTDQDIHGDISNATVTLTSKGKDGNGAQSSKTATIGARSILTPTFTMPSTFDFGEIYSMDSKGSGTGLYMSSPNKAANSNKTTWTATIEGTNAAYFTTTLNPTKGQCVVTYKPQAEGTHTATLKLYATYKDSKGTAIKSTVVQTTLTGTAKKPLESKIEFTPASVNFASVTHQEKYEDITLSIQNTSDVVYSFGSTNASGVFNYEVSDGSVRVSALSAYPGNFNAILTASGKDTRDGHSGETTEASLPIQVNVGLAAPTLKGSSNSWDAYFLIWNKIPLGNDYDAVTYKLYEVTNGTNKVEVVDAISIDTDDKHMGVKIPSTAASKVYVVEAMVEYNSVSYTAWSNQVSLTLNTLNGNIVDFYDVYTGTDCPSDVFPYKPKQRIDLSSCFDAAGNPLFDKLYIFGLTTNTNSATYTYQGQTYPRINTPTNPDKETTCFNATTPLYVYAKVQGGYQLDQTLDATKTRFDHNTSLNGQKIYLTGYCPFAYMGTTADEEGWMYFKGGNTAVDIYLENCEIRGRHKTVNGCSRTTGGFYDYADFTLELGLGDNYIKGCSSPFVFYSSATASGASYRPNFHIKGDNFLQGQYGMYIKSVVGKVVIEIETGITNIAQASAPITIRADKNSGKTNLIFDDNWADGTITNGYLKLISAMSHVGSLDLGSEAGEATFNGGQYHVRNAAADGNYTTNTVASFRRFSKTAMGFTIYLYGFGGDVPKDCKVTINSGTFTLEKNVNPSAGHAYYRDDVNFMDLRLPGQSVVNGGTFNGITNVVTCIEATTSGKSPVNGVGVELCLFNGAELTGETSYGTKTFRFDHASFDGIKFIDDFYGSANAIATDLRNASNMQSVISNSLYGAQSLNPDAEGKLNLLLPSVATTNGGNYWCEPFDNTLLRQWATCIPTINVSSSGQGIGVGGDIEVIKQIEGTAVETNYLLYLEVDEMMKQVEIVDGEMHIKCSTNRSSITNAENYKIQKDLNVVKSIEADQWMTIVAPFDVHNISVLESMTAALNESKLVGMTRTEAHEAQATNFLSFFNEISGFVIPDDAGRTTSHPIATLLDWYGIKPFELIHYNGNNIREANYYLYELDNLNADGSFSTNATGEELNITWKPVATPSENEPILKKGHIYAMQFPYCPLCGDAATRTEYDYWTGKFLFLHGKGPQELDGTNTHTSVLANPLSNAGSAILKGNTSLNSMTLPSKTGYIHNTTNDLFELNASNYSVKPLETFMLYNPLAARMPKAISRAGKVIYEEQTATGLPTIGDRTSLTAYADNMQIQLTALQAQRVVIYDMHGQVLFDGQLSEGEQMSVSAPQGMYIVKGTYEIIKLIVD